MNGPQPAAPGGPALESVEKLLEQVRARGVRLWVHEGNLRFAPRDGLSASAITALGRHKRELIATLTRQEHDDDGLAGRPRPSALPLSPGQEGLWFLARLEMLRSAYNVVTALRIDGEIDTDVVGRAIDEIVRRHEILRTRFRESGGEPVQVVMEHTGAPFRVTDLTALDAGEARAQERRALDRHGDKVFQLDREPLLIVELLHLSPREHLLIINAHHIVFDGWSLNIFLRELQQLYDAFRGGAGVPLPELGAQYADHAIWERRQLDGNLLATELRYWKARLADAPERIDLPTDYERPAVPDIAGSSVHFSLPADLAQRLGDIGRRNGATKFMVLLSAFHVLLSRWSGQNDICVGVPVDGRAQREAHELIGYFLNTVVVRADLSGDQPFDLLLREVRQRLLEAYEHRRLPFSRLIAEMAPKRELLRQPLVQVMFSYMAEGGGHCLGDATLTSEVQESRVAEYELSMFILEGPERLEGSIEYATGLFERETVQRLADQFVRLLDVLSRDPQLGIGSVPLLSPATREQILGTNPRPRPLERVGAHQLFERQVLLSPEATALVAGDCTLSYAELNAQSNRLARRLVGFGVGPESRVAICASRGWRLVAAILAVWKAGGAHVPLDPSSPDGRLRFLADDCSPHLLLTDREQLARFDGQLRAIVLDDICPPEPDGAAGDVELDANLDLEVDPSQLAYIIYTSGSTGKPKGVQVEQHSLVNLWLALRDVLPAPPPDAGLPRQDAGPRVAHTASFGFDTSLDQLSWLARGASLWMVKDEVRRDMSAVVDFIREHRIDVLDTTPSQLDVMVSLGLLDGQRWAPGLVGFGGEPIKAAQWASLRRVEHTRLVNLYGPTECTVEVTAQAVGQSPRPSIGRPIGNSRVYVVDRACDLVPVGVQGELWVGGTPVARGYWRRPKATAERFIEDPFAPGGRVYRTGDLARWRADGTLEFCGRIDDQVSIRGHRVEPGEIAGVLSEHPKVRAAAAVAHGDGATSTKLVAYVVCEGDDDMRHDLQAHLSHHLPSYLLPDAVVLMEALPLTANGKLDRDALPLPDGSRPSSDDTRTFPRTPGERTLAGIWTELLNLDEIDVHDNFFELGGDSLIAARVITQAKEAGLPVTLKDLFRNQTVASLARTGAVEGHADA